MRILVACEESQTVTIEMRRLGHEAYSCDIQECSGGHPEWHIQTDALELLKMKWDMIIAHPPCTYLSTCQSQLIFNKDGTVKNTERYENGLKAAEFFMKFYQADCDRIAVENPTPIKRLFNNVGGVSKDQSDHQSVYVRRSVEKADMFVVEGAAAVGCNDRIAGRAVGMLGGIHFDGKRPDIQREIPITRA